MSSNPDKESSLLAPVIGAYEPTDVDADRIFAKIEATLDAAPASRAPASPPNAIRSRAVLAGVSCIVLAVAAAVVFQTERSGSKRSSSAPAASAAALLDETRSAHFDETPTAPSLALPPLRSTATIAATGDPPIASVSVDTLPSRELPATAQPSRKPTASTPSSLRAPAPAADTLEQEARLLADARRASQAGAGDRALALLDEHARTFPSGWLANERDAERILVLCVLGRRAEATRAAAVFLEGRPKGPLTRRVEMSCAGSPESKGTE